jgi:hypothetical protein
VSPPSSAVILAHNHGAMNVVATIVIVLNRIFEGLQLENEIRVVNFAEDTAVPAISRASLWPSPSPIRVSPDLISFWIFVRVRFAGDLRRFLATTRTEASKAWI